MSNWIKCSERMPEDGTQKYFVLLNNVYPLVATYMFSHWSAGISCRGVFVDIDINEEVTHWQPLPEPPEDL